MQRHKITSSYLDLLNWEEFLLYFCIGDMHDSRSNLRVSWPASSSAVRIWRPRGANENCYGDTNSIYCRKGTFLHSPSIPMLPFVGYCHGKYWWVVRRLWYFSALDQLLSKHYNLFATEEDRDLQVTCWEKQWYLKKSVTGDSNNTCSHIPQSHMCSSCQSVWRYTHILLSGSANTVCVWKMSKFACQTKLGSSSLPAGEFKCSEGLYISCAGDV